MIACNNDNVWNESGGNRRLCQQRLAWSPGQTGSSALSIALGLLLVFVLYQFRVRQIANAIGARFDERLDERTRIARDFHDTLLQTIQGSKLVADSALIRADDPLRMREALEQLSMWLARATAEGRTALNSLRTSDWHRDQCILPKLSAGLWRECSCRVRERPGGLVFGYGRYQGHASNRPRRVAH